MIPFKLDIAEDHWDVGGCVVVGGREGGERGSVEWMGGSWRLAVIVFLVDRKRSWKLHVL